MTIVQLEYIIAVEKYQSFSLAAEKCFVTQPTLSMQIRKLEDELGVIIFKRDKQPIVPTEIGKKIIEQAKRILSEKERINILLQIEFGELKGSLRVAIIPTISSYLIPLFIRNFVNNYPEIELIIDEVTTDEIINGIDKNNYDVGIIALRSDSLNLVSETLYYEPFVALLPHAHKLSKKKKINITDLDINEILLLKEGHCLREQTLTICAKGSKNTNSKTNKIIFESGNLETLIRLVELNFGLTLLPYLAVKNVMNKRELLQIKEFHSPIPRREIALVYQNSFTKKHLLKALKDEILNVIPKELKTMKNGMIVR